jgi:hypothetical protein
MGTLIQDIKSESDRVVKAFAIDKVKLDYSINSFIEIDKFFNEHTKNGKGKRGGRLEKNYGQVLWAIGAYVGQTFIKVVPGTVWKTDDKAPDGELTVEIVFPDGVAVWPVQRVMKRFKNGSEDSIYVYGHELTKQFTKAEFNTSYWDLKSDDESKPWWKFW